MRLDLIRSEPAKGSCDVWWEVESLNLSDGVNATSGIAHFKPDETKSSIWIQLIADDEPEIKEEYTVKLTNIRSNGKRFFITLFKRILCRGYIQDIKFLTRNCLSLAYV